VNNVHAGNCVALDPASIFSNAQVLTLGPDGSVSNLSFDQLCDEKDIMINELKSSLEQSKTVVATTGATLQQVLLELKNIKSQLNTFDTRVGNMENKIETVYSSLNSSKFLDTCANVARWLDHCPSSCSTLSRS
jgi:tetrahydromethanopterin S-methyltransferase subunit B